MPPTDPSQATQLVQQIAGGNRSAVDQLFPLLYDAFHDIAARHLASERPGNTLSPTALVHEAYLKLVDQTRVDWRGRTHFLAVGAQAIRRILVDHARGKKRTKRGGQARRIALDEHLAISPGRDEDILAVDEAIDKLAKLDPRQAAIVELRFFGGLTVAEVAEALGIGKRTVEQEWTMLRAWFRRELAGQDAAE